ncbi:MAG: hypothetical protein AB1478_05675 [Nitrospirota bacterium]
MAQTLTKNEAYSIAKKVTEERKLNPDIIGKIEDLPVSEYIISFVIESLEKIAPIKAMLRDDDLLELKGYELNATNKAINEVYHLLDAAVDLHTRTH